MNSLSNKITIRLTNGQLQVLDELKSVLGVTYSLLLRTIVSDFLSRNEEVLERIITGQQTIEDDADYQQTTEERKIYFS